MVLVHSTTTRDFIVHNHMTWFKGYNQMHWEYNVFLLSQHVVMDWNERNIVYLLFSSLPSPSACVSDPTLTVENVTEVMGEVGETQAEGEDSEENSK